MPGERMRARSPNRAHVLGGTPRSGSACFPGALQATDIYEEIHCFRWPRGASSRSSVARAKERQAAAGSHIVRAEAEGGYSCAGHVGRLACPAQERQSSLIGVCILHALLPLGLHWIARQVLGSDLVVAYRPLACFALRPAVRRVGAINESEHRDNDRCSHVYAEHSSLHRQNTCLTTWP